MRKAIWHEGKSEHNYLPKENGLYVCMIRRKEPGAQSFYPKYVEFNVAYGYFLGLGEFEFIDEWLEELE